jgi:hypothetical protein
MKAQAVSSGCAHRTQRGFLLIMAVVLIVVVALLLSVMLFLGAAGNESSVDHSRSQQALFIAESGTDRALYGFTREGAGCAALSYTATLGAGGFTTSGTPYNPVSSTLSAAISNADTVIPLADVSGYAPLGRVSIGAEQINYGAVSVTACAPFSPPCLKAARRGVAGSTAVAHAAGQAVAQNQCLIGSTGTVGSASRTVHTAVAGGGGAGTIALGNTSTAPSNLGDQTSWNWSHTVNAGTNRMLIVGVSFRENRVVNSITYGGQPLVFAGRETFSALARSEIWYLMAPNIGTANITVTMSGSTVFVSGAVSLTGVSQTQNLSTQYFSSAANTSTPAVAVPAAGMTNNAWIMDVLSYRQNNPAVTATMVPATDRTQRWNARTGAAADQVGGAASTRGPISPAAATTMNWTLSSSRQSSLGAVYINPESTGSSVVYWRENF